MTRAELSSFDKLVPVLERVLLMTWIIKDFGWMTTNVFLGFPFGGISVLLHIVVLFIDRRRSFLLYNLSLVTWVCGNFIWMTTGMSP